MPFSYAPNEISDLGRANESHYVDLEHRLDAWTRRFFGTNQNDTLSVLKAINSAIKDEFEYLGREEEGVKAPRARRRLARPAMPLLSLRLATRVPPTRLGSRHEVRDA